MESLAADLDAVTRERMLEAAAGIRLDTVYFLRSFRGAAQKPEEKEGVL